MPWINRIPEATHPATRCKKPPVGGFAAGSVFECDDCKRHWRFDGPGQQDWTELPSGASDPAETWSNLLVDLDEDEASEKLTAFLTGPASDQP